MGANDDQRMRESGPRNVEQHGTGAAAKPRPRRRWWSPKGWRFWVLVAVMLYAGAGFLLLPWIVKRELVAFVERDLGRHATIESVRFNPFTFTISLAGLSTSEADGAALLDLDELFVDFEATSLVAPAWTFAEIRLTHPRVNFVRFPGGESNFGRVVGAMVGGQPEEKEETDSAGTVPILLRKVTLEGGELSFSDRSLRTPFDTRFGPVSLELRNFGTLPEHSGEDRFTVVTESGAELGWTGTLSLDPLRSSGHVSAHGERLRLFWRYLQDLVGFEVSDGRSSLGFAYDLSLEKALRFSVRDLELTVDDLAVKPKGAEGEVLRLPRLSAKGGRLEWPERKAGLKEIELSGVRLDLWRDEDGVLNLQRLLAPAGEVAPQDAPPERGEADASPQSAATPDTTLPAAKASEAAPWSLALDRLLVEHLALAFEDRSFPLRSGVEDLRLELRGVSNEPGARMDFDLAAAITTGGRLECRGQLGLEPFSAYTELSVTDVSLLPAQPLLDRVAQLKLDSALLSLQGALRSAGDETLSFDGRAALSDLAAEDTLVHERFVAWKELALSDLALRLDGRTIEARQLDLQAPYARIVIARDGSTNLASVLQGNGAPAEENPPADASAPPAKPFVVAIRKLSLHDGSANFADLSLPLPFDTGIHSLQGEIAKIASNDDKPAKIDLHGSVGEYGEARIGGELDLFAPESNADVEVAFRNLDMTKFTPYSAKFAGYRIDGGKLDLSLQYRLEKRKLRAGNRIVLDQLELGEEVESPDAVDVPLRFAVALLKDSSGRIDLDVPVTGSLDDPKFSYGKAVLDAFKNLLVRVVKSPFTLLASVVGAGEKLQYVLFAPGEPGLAPPEEERLAKLAEALVERPQLSLRVRGRFHRELDVDALQRAAVESMIAERLAADPDLSRRQALEGLFLDSFSRNELENLKSAHTRIVEPQILTGSTGAEPRLDEEGYLAALRARLAHQQSVGEDALTALGDKRAAAVVDYLTAKGVPPERIRRLDTDDTKKTVDGRVRLKLTLKTDEG